MKIPKRPWMFWLLVFIVAGAVWLAKSLVLLDDDYRSMTPGMLSPDVIGARTEYHYLSCAAPRGNWTVSAFRSDQSQRAWRLIEESGTRYIWQSYTEVDRDRPYTHPMIIAGDDLWKDYTVEVKFEPQTDPNAALTGAGRAPYECGILFRYHTSRVYYFAGIVGQHAVIKKVNDGVAFRVMDQTNLAESDFAWKPGEFITLKVTAYADKLTADFGNGVKLEARDAGITHGKFGFTSDLPAKFAKVRVTTSPWGKLAYLKAKKAREDQEAEQEAENPKMVLWKKIYTPGYGTARNIRFGDLEGNGKMDILLVQQNTHGPADGHSEVGCMTAINLDGKILWQSGTPDPWHDRLTSDVAVQIHDIEGTGKNDVIYCRDQRIWVADGATGIPKYSAPTPPSPPDTERRTDLYPDILGDAIYFADFRGLGAKRDFIVKDRYHNIWAYTDQLEPLWHLKLNTGHYPYAFNVDGRDELAIGYSLVSPDGKVIWNLENQLADDHADGVAIVSMKDGAPPRWICTASDDGFLEADLDGNILEHLEIGHAQNPSIGKFRPDLPGLQVATVDFWGTQGIVSFFDADGNKYHDFEAANYGSMMQPLNWKGDGQEYWILSPNSETGGVYDGWGRRVMRFPRDGHPDMCVATLDLTGDCRDEIVVWDPWEIWIYTQSDNPKTGRLYKPVRDPIYNESNYRASVSLPGWSE